MITFFNDFVATATEINGLSNSYRIGNTVIDRWNVIIQTKQTDFIWKLV